MSYLDIGNPWTSDTEYCCQCGEQCTSGTLLNGEATCSDCEALYI